MHQSIVFLVRVRCRKESSRSLSHLMMSFLFFSLVSTSNASIYRKYRRIVSISIYLIVSFGNLHIFSIYCHGHVLESWGSILYSHTIMVVRNASIWYTRRNTSPTFWHRLQYSRSIYTTRVIVWQPRRAADTSTNCRQPFCCCTASMEQAADGSWNCCNRRTRFVVIWKHFWFCLRAPGYGLALWCALDLLVGGATPVSQLQLQLHFNTVYHGSEMSISLHRARSDFCAPLPDPAPVHGTRLTLSLTFNGSEKVHAVVMHSK